MPSVIARDLKVGLLWEVEHLSKISTTESSETQNITLHSKRDWSKLNKRPDQVKDLKMGIVPRIHHIDTQCGHKISHERDTGKAASEKKVQSQKHRLTCCRATSESASSQRGDTSEDIGPRGQFDFSPIRLILDF